MGSTGQPRRAAGDKAKTRATLSWIPTVVLLGLWIAVFLLGVYRGRTLSNMTHWTIGFWWDAVTHSITTQVIALVFVLPILAIGARGLILKDQRQIALAVFLFVAAISLSLIVMAMWYAGQISA